MRPFSFAGVFLLSASALLFQVLLTRILSITQGYHFAFLVVSLAMLGFGAAGTFLAMTLDRIRRAEKKFLIFVPVVFSLFLVGDLWILNHFVIDRYALALSVIEWLKFSLFILALSLPFFCVGTLLGALYSLRSERVGTTYAFDLMGASVGSLAFMPLGYLLPPHHLYGLIILAGALASLFFALAGRSPRGTKFSIAALLVFALGMSVFPVAPFRLSPYKSLELALRYPNSTSLAVAWNPFSQVNLIESPAARFAPGLSLTYQKELPPQKGITVDGEQLNAVTQWDGKRRETIDFLASLPSAALYEGLPPPEKVLVINPGGGLNVLEALYWGAKKIDVIEPNPLITAVASQAFSPSPFEFPHVTVYHEDIRHFLSRSRELYDRIVISVTENPAAASNGLYGMTENYLFTQEAFSSFEEHLSAGGLLTVTRYSFVPYREEPRLIRLIYGSYAPVTITDSMRWIRTWGTHTLILKKGPILDAEQRRLVDFCDRLGFRDVTKEMLDELKRPSLFDRSIPTDDRPFFYQFIRISHVPELLRVLEGRWDILLEGGLIAWIVLLVSLLYCLLFILLPLSLKSSHRRGSPMISRPSPLFTLSYFALIGLGFMFVEMALVHRSILYFSHPSTAVSFSLSTLLLSTGLGSLLLFRKGMPTRPRLLFALLSFLCLGFFVGLPHLSPLLLGLSDPARFVTLFVCFFPVGFFMGFPYAAGIRSLSGSVEWIPWGWGVNATFSVMGAISSLLIAMQTGFLFLFVLSFVCYALCLIVSRRLFQRAEQTGHRSSV